MQAFLKAELNRVTNGEACSQIKPISLNVSTWIVSDYRLQLSDLRHCCLGDQAVHQGIVGYGEAERGQLRTGFGVQRVRDVRGRRVGDVGQEHAARRVTERQRGL